MKSTNNTLHTTTTNPHTNTPNLWTPKSLKTIRTTARDFANPVDYQHPFPSMARFAEHLALSYDANRTRHSYYRQLRLIHQHLGCDPVNITEAQLRDYFLFVKLKKQWKPKSIRQALAAASMFFVNLFGHADWTVFSQIRTKDHDTLPEVLTRQQVHDLLAHIPRLPNGLRVPWRLLAPVGLFCGGNIFNSTPTRRQKSRTSLSNSCGSGSFARLHQYTRSPLASLDSFFSRAGTPTTAYFSTSAMSSTGFLLLRPTMRLKYQFVPLGFHEYNSIPLPRRAGSSAAITLAAAMARNPIAVSIAFMHTSQNIRAHWRGASGLWSANRTRPPRPVKPAG